MAFLIADSDVLIDYLRSIEPGGSRIATAIQDRSLVTTVVSEFELLRGAQTERQRSGIARLLSLIPILPLDRPSAREAARIAELFDRAGTPMAAADLLIGGIALSNELPLLTRNRRHFERIPGLVLEPLPAQ